MIPNTEMAGRIIKLLVGPTMPVPGLWIMVASPILKGVIIMSSESPHSEWSVTMGVHHSLLSVAVMRSQQPPFQWPFQQQRLTITSHKLKTVSANTLQIIIMIITVTPLQHDRFPEPTDSNQQILRSISMIYQESAYSRHLLCQK